MPELEKSMEQRIDFYYKRASILPANKFLVGLYGPYVTEALVKLGRDAEFTVDSNTNKAFGANKIYQSHLNKFVVDHVTENGKEVELKWATKGVTIPTVQSEIIEDINIDTTKTINYPLIKGHAPTGIIKLDIVENRTMTMYHFFNAVMNRFFNPKILKPKSSFQKMGMYIIILNQDVLNPNSKDRSVNDVPLQVFEFNSITPIGITDIPLSSDNPAKKMEFSISFKAPNLFQSSFKTINEFKGIRDNTTDKSLLKMFQLHTDVGGMDSGNSEYSTQKSSTGKDTLYNFEVKESDLRAGANDFSQNNI